MKRWVANHNSQHNKHPRRSEIISEAQAFLQQQKKPSKGWCDKFIKRNKFLFLPSKEVREEIGETNRRMSPEGKAPSEKNVRRNRNGESSLKEREESSFHLIKSIVLPDNSMIEDYSQKHSFIQSLDSSIN